MSDFMSGLGSVEQRLVAQATEKVEQLKKELDDTRDAKKAAKIEKRIAGLEKVISSSLQKVQKQIDKDSKGLTPAQIEMYGKCIYKSLFGFTKVMFYEKGYAKVGMAEPALLRSISADAHLSSKTLPGRAASQLLMAPLTGGLSLMSGAIAPNQRGSLILSIVTTSKAHILKVDTPMDSFIKVMYEAEGVGNALLAKIKAESQVAETNESGSGVTKDLASQLTQLNQLRQQGALSDEEFAKAKDRLLG